jgi:hypothetical protein
MVMKPSAPLNVVTDPEPLPIGYALSLPSFSTRPTSRYSVRPALGVDAHRQRRRHRLAPLPRQAGERADHRRDELVEREDRRRRKARQDDDRLAVADGEADRLAGLERDAVRDDPRIAEPARDAIREISCALRRPTRKQHDVVLERARQRCGEGRFLVADDTELHRLAAELGDRRADDRGVRVVDRAERQRRSRRDDLVAGRQDRHPRPPADADFGNADRGEDADLARRQHLTGAQHGLAARDVGAGIADVLACGDGAADLDDARAVAFGHDLGVLDHHDGVGAARQHRAGRDHRRTALADDFARDDAWRQQLGVEREPAPVFFAGAEGVGGLHREAVDVRSVEAGHVDRGDDVDAEDASERIAERDGLVAERREREVAAEALGRFVAAEDAQELRLAAVGGRCCIAARSRVRHRFKPRRRGGP